jgi:hypothetical protein
MAYFKTKNHNLGKFVRTLEWKMLVILKAVWSILRSFGVFRGHLIHFMFIWYILSRSGRLYQEKSGNPDNYFWLDGSILGVRNKNGSCVMATRQGISETIKTEILFALFWDTPLSRPPSGLPDGLFSNQKFQFK